MVPPPAKASPLSLRSTRLYDVEEAASGVVLIGSGLLVASYVGIAGDSPRRLGLAHLEAGEAQHLDAGLVEDLADGLLVVLREGLLDQDVLLEEPGHAALHD